MKDCDPVSWRIAESEWIDSEVSDDIMITFDNGDTHFWVSDVESYLDQEETQSEAAG